jgi:hypothetical protein
MKIPWQITKISLIFLGISSFSLLLLLSSSTKILSYPQPKQNFPAAPNNPPPHSTIGGGARLIEYPASSDNDSPNLTNGSATKPSGCSYQYEIPWTALVPQDQIITTLSSQVNLFFYIPQPSSQQAEFRLLDEDNQEIYIQALNLPKQAGVVKIQLPNKVFLELNKFYKWNFTLICDAHDSSKNESISGLIKRFALYQLPNESNINYKRKQQLLQRLTELKVAEKSNLQIIHDLESQNASNNEEELDKIRRQEDDNILEQAKIYAEFSLWNETITRVSELESSVVHKDSHFQEFKHHVWEDLLKSVGLESVIHQTLMDCCISENLPN